MVDNLAVPEVKLADNGYILFAQREIPNIQVFFNALFVSGFWDNHYTTLRMPAKDNLRDGFVVLFGNGG